MSPRIFLHSFRKLCNLVTQSQNELKLQWYPEHEYSGNINIGHNIDRHYIILCLPSHDTEGMTVYEKIFVLEQYLSTGLIFRNTCIILKDGKER